MRQLFIDQEERGTGLLKHFSASTSKQVAIATATTPSVWRCELNVPGESWQAIYLGPSSTEVWSFLAWRLVEIHEVYYREAISQYTEREHRRKGYAALLLQHAIHDPVPLMSDREGLTYAAFKFWYSHSKGNGQILDTHSGELLPFCALTKEELWNTKDDCERYQITFTTLHRL